MTKFFTQSYYDTRLHIGYALIGSCLLAILIYGVNIYRVISETVMLQQTEKAASSLSSNVQQLDASYLNLSSKLTPDRFPAFGLHEAPVTTYISRSSSLGRVALSAHEF